MSSAMDAPKNRRERRKQARNEIAVDTIPLAKPDFDKPRGEAKTLFDLAAEREHLLQAGRPFTAATNGAPRVTEVEDNAVVQESRDVEDDDEIFGRLGQAIFYASTLSMLHFTLDVLVHHQYRMEVGWWMIARRSGLAFPVISLLVYALHDSTPTLGGPISSLTRLTRTSLLRQLFFLVMSVATGTYLVKAANEEPYFAVMKRAPPLGTLWVWSVIELRFLLALTSVLCVGIYIRWGGYSIM